jgi:hypothetical protein
MKIFSEFEKWALTLPVPAFNLPALINPSDSELWRRAVEISYDIARINEGEIALATILIQLGSIGYLEEVCRK